MNVPTTRPTGCPGSNRARGATEGSSGSQRDGHHPELETSGEAARNPHGAVWAALGSFALSGFVVFAVAIEVLAAEYSDSPVPSWTVGVFPLTWSQPVRVLWWLTAAAACFASRVLMRAAGVRVRRWATFMFVSPFVVFALGVAWGRDWATWH